MFSFKELFRWEKDKEYVFQTAFLIFILLNILDFLNVIEGDLDFFKKLMSWLLIAYIFYFVSFTKVLIGKRIPGYDLLYIVAFSLMSIVKALLLYALTVFGPDRGMYAIFYAPLQFIAELPTALFLYSTFMIGFLLTIILSISLLLNNKPTKDSFVGSLNIKEGYFKYVIEQTIVVIMSVFFGIILFNLFMEWFALAVDSLLLVLGMFYYFYMNLHDRNKARGSHYIKEVANTGNQFYSSLIKLFSNKYSVFIGISFLLTLHSVVDAGVYLVPYSLGTESTLYFNSFSSAQEDQHIPLFNFMNPDESLLFTDLTNANGDLVLSLSIVLSYLLTLLFFFTFMLMPFYIFYNNVRDAPINLNKTLAILMISSIIYYLFLLALPGVQAPLLSKTPDVDSSIRGVDIISQPITENLNPYELVGMSLIYFVILLFLFYRYSLYEVFFKKILLFAILIFFLIYIVNFAGNFIHVEYEKLKTDVLELEEHKQINEQVFSNLKEVYDSKITFTSTRKVRINVNDHTFSLQPFSDLRLQEGKIVEFQEHHHDFLYVTITSEDPFFMRVDDLSTIFFESNIDYEIRSNNYLYIREGEVDFIYILDANHFELIKSNQVYKVNFNLDQKVVSKLFTFGEPSAIEILQKLIEYLRLIFTSIFYLFGITAFLFFYFNKNFIHFVRRSK